MKTRWAVLPTAVLLLTLAGCSQGQPKPMDVVSSSSTPAAQASTTPSAQASATPETVAWQDPTPMIMLPNASTSSSLPHGPSWVTEDGAMFCGIYDDWTGYDKAAATDTKGVYYGCRFAQDAAITFTYPPVKGAGEIGGCPSGFAASAGKAAAPLCNSGQVFSSETGGGTVLLPGQGVRFAGIQCVALSGGMDCTETATGHGFHATLGAFTLS